MVTTTNNADSAQTASPLVLREAHEGVVTLTLNQAQRFNPLSEAMLATLTEHLRDVSTDPQVRVVVLAANGPAFCAGHDLREMRAQPSTSYYKDLFQRCTQLMLSIIDCPVPVIARVQGLATAAGCQLVATCDLAVAADTAKFAVSGVTLGLFCSTPSVALTRNVPRKQAFEMLITGEFIDAPTALRYGLVNRIGPLHQLDSMTEELCASVKRHPPVAVSTGKRMFYNDSRQALSDAYQHAGEVMACNMMEQDTLEGVQAFLDKREPHWSHRN
jgi:enoyl-CoA hydratase/carnithine racemase